MRETCTYGSMRGSRRKTAKSVLRVVEDRAGVPDEGRPALLYTPWKAHAFTERGLYMLATVLKSEKAERATLAIIETYAHLRSMVRDMEALQALKDGSPEQAAQLTRTGHKLATLIGDNLSTESTKTTIELNLAVLKITHEVTRTKKRK